MAAHRATQPGDTFELHWHAFYLNPQAPAFPGGNKRELYEAKFGGAARVNAIFARLTAAGHSAGIEFRFGGNTGRTRDSHRLLYLAGQKYGAEVQTKIAEALFRAYFEEEANITDRAVLLKAAVQGTDSAIAPDEVQRWLNDDDADLGGKEVDREAYEATARFVTGVPHFTIQGKYVIEGGQEPEAFLDVFERVKADGL